MWIYIAHCRKISNALDTLVPAEKPSFQTMSEGLIVLLCTEVVRQGVPNHGAVHSECSSACSPCYAYCDPMAEARIMQF